jgi:hypothetical protein
MDMEAHTTAMVPPHIDHPDRWIGNYLLAVEQYRALQELLAHGMVESAAAVADLALRLRVRTRARRVTTGEPDPGLDRVIEAILDLVDDGLLELQVQQQQVVGRTLRRARHDLALRPRRRPQTDDFPRATRKRL